MKKTKITYWIFTGLIAAAMLASAIPDALIIPSAVTFMTQLGYPNYLIPFLGVAKILGVIAILIPGYPRIKEWAYAGLAFDLIGAIYSLVAIHTPISGWLPICLPLALLAGSYIFYHKRLREDGLKNKSELVM